MPLQDVRAKFGLIPTSLSTLKNKTQREYGRQRKRRRFDCASIYLEANPFNAMLFHPLREK